VALNDENVIVLRRRETSRKVRTLADDLAITKNKGDPLVDAARNEGQRTSCPRKDATTRQRRHVLFPAPWCYWQFGTKSLAASLFNQRPLLQRRNLKAGVESCPASSPYPLPTPPRLQLLLCKKTGYNFPGFNSCATVPALLNPQASALSRATRVRDSSVCPERGIEAGNDPLSFTAHVPVFEFPPVF
jgi:hypothetical protein